MRARARYIMGRLLQALAVVAGVLALTFALARLVPGDPAVAYAGPRATPEQLAQVREQFGLDRPPLEQFVSYIAGVARGDWGIALHTRAPVLEDILRYLPTTLQLVVLSLIIAVGVGVPLGAYAASARGAAADLLTSIIAILAVSMPTFWLAILLQQALFSQLGWLPAAGAIDRATASASPLYVVTGAPLLDALLTGNWSALASTARHLVLPVLTMAAYPLGACALVTRAAMSDTLGEEHVQMVRALGFGRRAILTGFALRPSLNPILALVVLLFAFSLTNSFIVESVYNLPGLGSYAIDSIQSLDIPAITGITLFIAVTYVILNLVVDIVQTIVDPRTAS